MGLREVGFLLMGYGLGTVCLTKWALMPLTLGLALIFLDALRRDAFAPKKRRIRK